MSDWSFLVADWMLCSMVYRAELSANVTEFIPLLWGIFLVYNRYRTNILRFDSGVTVWSDMYEVTTSLISHVRYFSSLYTYPWCQIRSNAWEISLRKTWSIVQWLFLNPKWCAFMSNKMEFNSFSVEAEAILLFFNQRSNRLVIFMSNKIA